MIQLLRENPRRVVSFITFTRTSRRDTDRRLREAVSRRAVEIEPESFPRISTLHGFAKSLVHRYAASLGRTEDFSVLVTGQGERDIVLSEVKEDLNVTLDHKELDKAITQFRATGEWPAHPQLTESQRVQVIKAFDFLLRFYDTFDWEGLVLTACEILERGASDLPPVLLQVDEYQDLNRKDQELIRLASGTQSSQVVVVGDDAQSIYGWRHAHLEGIRELWESKEWDRVPLRECHRLPPHILRAAHSLIKDKNYLGAEVRLPEDDGRRLLTLQCTRDQQIKAVAGQIGSLSENARKLDGSPLTYRDFMVLCPTNALADQAARELSETYRIPTRRQKRGDPIPDDVWKLLLVLRMLDKPDGLALRQWLQVIGLSPAHIREIRRGAMQSRQSLHDYCSALDDERISRVFESIKRLSQARVDILQFRQALRDFPDLPATAAVQATVDEIIEYVPAVRMMIGNVYEKYGVVDAEGEGDDIPDEDKVLVSTMHSAKGLEAEFVFIMWLNDGLVPVQDRDPLEEERVFYVALTRARQDIILTFQEKWDSANHRLLGQEAMSPFLKSIRDHLDVRRVKASDLD
jgi:DNA helicase-2/ATP-dependent DNA helicase PcrA